MKLTGSSNSRTGTNTSSHNVSKSIGSNNGTVAFKHAVATGQENRRPLLQRMFGPGGKQVLTAQQHQANSVGPASRGANTSNPIQAVHSGFMSGNPTKQRGNHSTPAINQHSTKPSTTIGMNSSKPSHLARIQNSNVISAAPASHPPVLAQYGAQSLENSQNNILDASNAVMSNDGSTNGAFGVTSVAQRSISRARQFGKDLTNMFSFTRSNGSRQSSKGGSANQQTSLISGSQNATSSVGRHKVIQSSMNTTAQGSLPRSARHNQQPQQPGSFDYSTKNVGGFGQQTHLPAAVGTQNNNIRKSSLNSQNGVQKSLNSLEYSKQTQNSGINSSNKRPLSGFRSRDKLPQIGFQTKLAQYQRRIDQNVNSYISKIDKATLSDIYHVSDYCADIQRHMQMTERQTQPDGFYMKRQKKINENVRSILVDWLITVHAKFKCLPETLFITVNLIDRYLAINVILQDMIQLLGIAALLIATKYEEIYPPTVKDFIFLTDSTYSRSQILEMEKKILFDLQFEIIQTSPYRFLERYSKIAKADTPVFFLAQYLLELGLLDSKMNQYPPSLLASTALYVALRITITGSLRNRGNSMSVWTRDMIENTGYQNSDLLSCSKNYFQLGSLIQKSELQAILRKFTSPKFLEVARIMNKVTREHDYQNAQIQAAKMQHSQGHQSSNAKQKTIASHQANSLNGGTALTHASHKKTATMVSSNGKKRGASSASTGKMANGSHMNSTSGSVKQMTGKSTAKASSSQAMSADSRKH